MTNEEIQAEAERLFPNPDTPNMEMQALAESYQSAFILGCNFATSRHEEEMKEVVGLLMDYKADLLFKRSSAGLIAQDEDNLQAINNLINRVKPKQ